MEGNYIKLGSNSGILFISLFNLQAPGNLFRRYEQLFESVFQKDANFAGTSQKHSFETLAVISS